MATTNELTRLRDRIDALKKEKDKATGALEQIESKLKQHFDCNTIAEANVKLKKLTKEADQAESRFDAALQKFKQTYGDQL